MAMKYRASELKNKYRRAWRPLRASGIIMTCLLGAVLFSYLFGATVFDVQGLTINVSITPSLQGKTVVELPPLGNVAAVTHRGPVLLKLKLEKIETEAIIKTLAASTDHKDIWGAIQVKFYQLMRIFLLRQVLLGAIGAFALVWLVWRTRLRVAIASGLSGALVLALVLLAGGMTYEVGAFNESQYEGAISLAPDAVRIVEDSLANYEKIKHQTGQVVANMHSLFNNLDSIAVLGDSVPAGPTRKVLLVSDLHSNPVGVQLTRTIAQKFGVDFIVNAGDLTDFGSPLETGMVEELQGLGVPQVFVPGNHDTPDIIKFMATLPHTQVLQARTIELDGISILGVADPLAYSSQVSYTDQKTEADGREKQLASINELVKKQGRPDMIIVHNPAVAGRLAELTHLVVCGHTHQQELKQTGKSVLINPGTIGAAGIRGFYAEKSAYAAVIVEFEPGNGPLVTDFIKYDLMSRKFSLERHLLR